MASVRFICGTQTVHKQLEAPLSRFLGTEDTILYSSCWDANGGLFETVLGEQDAIISDALNHASIIDGIRLCKAQRLRYANRDLAELEAQLQRGRRTAARAHRHRRRVLDGRQHRAAAGICDLADKYGALVMVDDSHATGFMGAGGRGTPEHCGVMGRIDFLTGTFGKALGGGSGGYTRRARPIVAWLRQRSRPYLFSQHASRRWSRRRRCARSIWSRTSPALRDSLLANAPSSAPACKARASNCCPASIRSSR